MAVKEKEKFIVFQVGKAFKDQEANIDAPVREITGVDAEGKETLVAKVYERIGYPQEGSIVFSVKVSKKAVEKVQETVSKNTDISTFLEIKEVE